MWLQHLVHTSTTIVHVVIGHEATLQVHYCQMVYVHVYNSFAALVL